MTTDIGADELRIRHILRRNGVGPDALTIPPKPTQPPTVGVPQPQPEPEQAAPASDDQPAEKPTTKRRAPWASRLPDWRKRETVDLTKPDDEDDEPADEEDAADDESDSGPDTPPDTADTPDKTEPKPRTRRVPKTPRPARTPGHRLSGHVQTRVRNPRLRAIAFNATAATVGYATGLVPLLGHYLPAGEAATVGMTGGVLAVLGGYTAWRLAGLQAFAQVLPYPAVCRVLLTACGAEFGRRLAPLPVAWLAVHGAPYGLGPNALSLLVTCTAMCGGLWWLLDRPVRGWHPAVRWAARVPLASALLATFLYAPGR